MSLRDRVESFFALWSEYVIQHSKLILLLVIVVTAIIVPQIRHATMDLSVDSFLTKTDPSVAAYDAFREQFGYGDYCVVTIASEGDFFTLDNLQRLRALHEDLEQNVPHLETITSLVNVRHTRGEGDELIVQELRELWPSSEADIPAFRKLVLNNPVYTGSLVSSDGHLASVVLEPASYSEAALVGNDDEQSGFDNDESTPESSHTLSREDYLTPDEESDFAKNLLEIADKHQQDSFTIYSSGTHVVNYSMSEDMGMEMGRSTMLGLAIIALLLYLLFRRFSGVWMPLLVVSLSTMVTIALMPIFGFAINGNTQILPTFLLAIGVADSVHILSVFYKLYDNGEEKLSAIVNAMKSTSVAVVMTSLTTAAGLLSFAAADLLPIRSLGIFGAIGALLALYYTIVLLPALLTILPVRRRSKQQDNTLNKSRVLKVIDSSIFALGDFGVRRAHGVLLVSLLLTGVAVVGLSKVQFSHDPIRWYPENHPIRVASELMDNTMNGALSMQVILDSQKENGLYDPAFLQLMDEAKTLIESRQVNTTQAKQATSIVEVVKETHRALNGGDEAYYLIPDDRSTVAQELFLFETSSAEDLGDFTDSSFQLGRFTVQIPWTNVIGYAEYINTLQAELEEKVSASGVPDVSVTITGLIVIFSQTVKALLTSMTNSYAVAFLLVGLLMFLLMGSLRGGLLAFIPNVLPIIFSVGLMGWMNIPLNMMTAMAGCIIIGISVDDTIHFMHHYRRYAAREADPRRAVHHTLAVVGRAIVFTSVVLVGGFIVHVFDTFSAARDFGILLSFSIVIALLSNLLLAPALMTVFWRNNAPQHHNDSITQSAQ